MAQIARMEPTSVRCAPRSACKFRRWVWSSISLMFCVPLRVGVEQDVARRHAGGIFDFDNARPSGGIAGAHQFREAVAVAAATCDQKFARRRDLQERMV